MGLQEELDKLLSTDSPMHKRMVEYVVGQLAAGRHLEEIMQDPFSVGAGPSGHP
jgi:hypothetical protein